LAIKGGPNRMKNDMHETNARTLACIFPHYELHT
jgi:hypothetical protein